MEIMHCSTSIPPHHGLSHCIVDLYSEFPDRLASVHPRLMSLSNVVNAEVKYEEQLLQLLGTMDSIFSMSHKPQQAVTNPQMSMPPKSSDVTDLGLPTAPLWKYYELVLGFRIYVNYRTVYTLYNIIYIWKHIVFVLRNGLNKYK